MPIPRYLKPEKRVAPNHGVITNELEFSEELTVQNLQFEKMQPIPQPKDYDEIEY